MSYYTDKTAGEWLFQRDGFKITIGTKKDRLKNPLVNHDYTVAEINDNSLQAHANAAYICKAVNSHDKLVAALTLCAQYMGELNGIVPDTINPEILNSINKILNETK